MRIPEIRDRLTVLAEDMRQMALNLALDADELQTKARQIEQYVAEMHRRRTKGRAPRSSAELTPALKRQIIAYAKAHPRTAQAKIAEVFNVNIGRVSETLSGVRR